MLQSTLSVTDVATFSATLSVTGSSTHAVAQAATFSATLNVAHAIIVKENRARAGENCSGKC
jgi:hypothetical protein